MFYDTGPRNLPQSGATEMCFTQVSSSLTLEHETRLEGPVRVKQYSLLLTRISYGCKKVYKMASGEDPSPLSLDKAVATTVADPAGVNLIRIFSPSLTLLRTSKIECPNLFAQMKTTLKKVLSFISDISSIRYNI
jgi:hypothetical protein